MAGLVVTAKQIYAQSTTNETGKSVLKVGTHYTTYQTAEDESVDSFLPKLGFCAAYKQAVTKRKTLSLRVQYSVNNYAYGINYILPAIGLRRNLSLEI